MESTDFLQFSTQYSHISTAFPDNSTERYDSSTQWDISTDIIEEVQDDEAPLLGDKVLDILVVYVGPVLMVVGSLNNVLTAVVILNCSALRRRSTGLYMVVLAVMDTAILNYGMLFNIFDHRGYSPQSGSNIGCKLIAYFVSVLYEYEAWVLVNMNLERVIAVYRPLKAKFIFTRFRAAIGLVITAIIILAVNSVYLHIYQLVILNFDGEKGQYCTVGKRYFHLLKDYLYWVDFSLSSMVPFLVMLACSMAIVHRVFITNVKRSHMLSTAKFKVSSMTLTLLALSLTFVVLSAPVCIVPLIYHSLADSITTPQRQRFWLALDFAEYIAFFNYVINFYLYFVSNPRFRSELLILLRLQTKIVNKANISMTKMSSRLNLANETGTQL